jgi:hypothetical protein
MDDLKSSKLDFETAKSCTHVTVDCGFVVNMTGDSVTI